MKDQPNSISGNELIGKATRLLYQFAYSDLRYFYAQCRSGRHDDKALMQIKYDLWRKHGKYIDLAWKHHFSMKVSETTGIGSWHGWRNAQRLHTYAPDWQAFYCRCVIPF